MEVTRCPAPLGARRLSTALVALLSTAACSGDAARVDAPGDESGTETRLSRGLRAAYVATVQNGADASFAFAPAGAGHARAENVSQGFAVQLDAGSLRVQQAAPTPAWTLGLRWTGIGRGEEVDATAPPGEPDIAGNRGIYRRGDGSEEWYLNGPLGVEQGFRLREPPRGDRREPLVLVVEIAGELAPALAARSAYVSLGGRDGAGVLRYSDLYAKDATGLELSATMAVRAGSVHLVVHDAMAFYPIDIDPLVWGELEKLAASDGSVDDSFGTSVAVDGDTAIVGAHLKTGGGSDAGAAYIFERNLGGPGNWGELKKLTASDAQADDQFGTSVAISGDTVVVGAPREDGVSQNTGAAYVFERDLGGVSNWGERKKLTATDANFFDYFGRSVAISGDTLVVGTLYGASVSSDLGSAYVLDRDLGGADQWGERKKLVGTTQPGEDRFGQSVAIAGDTVIVGAFQDDGGGATRGAAYVFERDLGGADQWGERTKIGSSDAEDGDLFGFSVAISNDTAVVGAYSEDGAGLERGAAYVIERNLGGPDSWGEAKKLTASDAANDDWFGSAVAISGDRVVVGAPYEDGAAGDACGAAYLFERDFGGIGNWGEVQKVASNNPQDQARLGISTAPAPGDVVLVGAPSSDNGQGAVYVFGLASANGDGCSVDGDCASGHCIDGVCCDTACGAGDPGDCMACSIATGAILDGTCAALTGGQSCDDGQYCTLNDACANGVCTGGADPCPGPDGDADCNESCDEAVDACSAYDGDGAPCAGGACEGGTCANEGGGGQGGAGQGGATGTGTGGSGTGTGTGAGAAGGGGAGGATSAKDPPEAGGCSCRLLATKATRPVPSTEFVALLVLLGTLAARRRAP